MLFDRRRVERDAERMSVDDYLQLCKSNPTVYRSAHERMLEAIGEPTMVDTRKDSRLSRIHANKTIKVYPAFAELYGLQGPLEQVVSYFRHAAQGLEEKKQVLYLMGPVGGGKSSIAERLKHLMQTMPFYALEGSPVNESPLGLFPLEDAAILQKEYGIPKRYLNNLMSPWAVKRLEEYGGDIRRFTVVKRYPSILKQIGISKTEPGDENNQDISSLVGKVDIRKLEKFGQDDTDAYSYSGGLCLANQGLLEFVEMFKAPIKVLHPLLTATQEGNFKGTEGFGAIPFDGIVLAHSNESEWKTFRNNKNNEAFLDRVYIVDVPYSLEVSEEVKIYEKLIRESSLAHAPRAPGTLELIAQFSVLTRLKDPGGKSSLFSKMQVYDGVDLQGTDPRVQSCQAYRDLAGVDEGMSGVSTRFAYKVISKVFNFDPVEVAADPLHAMYVLEEQILKEGFAPETEDPYFYLLNGILRDVYIESLGRDIQAAYLASYSSYGQDMFDIYVAYADHWMQKSEFKDPESGDLLTRQDLDEKLADIEKSARIPNPKDFRNDVVNFVHCARAENGGKNPVWTSYQKMRTLIEKNIFSNMEELIPVLTAGTTKSASDKEKHDAFLGRMTRRGYTERQARTLCEWYLRVRKVSKD